MWYCIYSFLPSQLPATCYFFLSLARISQLQFYSIVRYVCACVRFPSVHVWPEWLAHGRSGRLSSSSLLCRISSCRARSIASCRRAMDLSQFRADFILLLWRRRWRIIACTITRNVFRSKNYLFPFGFLNLLNVLLGRFFSIVRVNLTRCCLRYSFLCVCAVAPFCGDVIHVMPHIYYTGRVSICLVISISAMRVCVRLLLIYFCRLSVGFFSLYVDCALSLTRHAFNAKCTSNPYGIGIVLHFVKLKIGKQHGRPQRPYAKPTTTSQRQNKKQKISEFDRRRIIMNSKESFCVPHVAFGRKAALAKFLFCLFVLARRVLVVIISYYGLKHSCIANWNASHIVPRFFGLVLVLGRSACCYM